MTGLRFWTSNKSVSATPADNAARVVSFLQRNPNVKYVIATAALQPATALNNAGLGSQVKIVGMYPKNESDVAAVKDGQVLAYAAGEIQVPLLAGCGRRGASDGGCRYGSGTHSEPAGDGSEQCRRQSVGSRELPGHLQDGLAQVDEPKLRSI